MRRDVYLISGYRIFRLLLVGLVAYGANQAAAAFAQPSVPNVPSKVQIIVGSFTDMTRFNDAMAIVSAKCINCHKNGGSASDFTNMLSVEARWAQVNYVVPGQSKSSLLYRYLQGSGFSSAPLGTMPIGGTLTAAELNTFKLWIEFMGAPSMTPMPTATPNTGGKIQIPSQDYPRLGDRIYMKSVFDDVFGPGAAATTNVLVLPSGSIFGGSCDPMKQAPASTQFGGDTCADLDVSSYSAPMVPTASAPRAGLTMKVCNILLFNDVTLQYAIKNATQRTDLAYLSSNSIPSSAEIIAAYTLFFSGKDTPPPAAISSLLALAQSVQSATFPSCPANQLNCQYDPWRYVLLALCYQPDWQVL